MSRTTSSFAAASLQQHSTQSTPLGSQEKANMPRVRRTSSSLGGDLRGDTGASALSTLEPTPRFNTPLSSPSLSPRSSKSKVPRTHSKRRKARSYIRRWKNFTFQYTWANPLIIIILALAFYAINPTSSNPLHGFIFISYPLSASHPFIPAHARADPNPPTHYGKGARDFLFVAFYVVVLSFTREFIMQSFLRRWAIYSGLKSRNMQNRYMEQAYTAIYFCVSGPVGLYVMSRTPVWYFNTEGMFADFPHRSHEGIFKAYYLLQASYWAQQAIVLCLQQEKPRKDFKELVAHHIITLTLIWLSYRFHFTYMGVAVYVTHDISDFFLATSKTFNYAHHPIIMPWFTLFIGVWIYLRHYINLNILYAVLTTFRTVGPFELNWETQQYKCSLSQYITFSLLAALQSINLFWLYCILRIAINVVLKDDARDVRSDDEEVEEQGSDKKHIDAGKDSLVASGLVTKERMNGQPNGHLNGRPKNGAALNGVAGKGHSRAAVEPARNELKKER